MRKRMMSILLAVCVALCLIPTAAFAEGSTAPADITGTGASDDPYLIYTAAGLKAFRDKVNGQNGLTKQPGAHARLMNDIVLNDGTFDADGNYTPGASCKDAEKWTPIGYFKDNSDRSRYAGTFDGDRHTIKGLYVKEEGEYAAGLFGFVVNATIKNVTVDGYVSISGTYAGKEYATTAVGGIAGDASETSIIGCANRCTVKSDCFSVAGGSYVGGIVGNVKGGSSVTVTNCRNSGKVMIQTSNIESDIGGIAGYAQVDVRDCCNTGAITAVCDTQGVKTLGVGGVIGRKRDPVSGCYNTGAVTVTGSFTAAENMDSFPCFGGITGVFMGDVYEKEYVRGCYNTGAVTYTGSCEKVSIGAVAGLNSNGFIADCYFLTGTAAKGVGATDGGINIYDEKNILIGTEPAQSDTAARTKAAFADGTVLAELKKATAAGTWKDECGYLAAAGMTLPLLNWQTEDGGHSHDYDTWEHNDTAHWKVCACGLVAQNGQALHSDTDDGDCTTPVKCECGFVVNAAQTAHCWGEWTHNSDDTHTGKCQNTGCTASATEPCSGGTATCQNRAVCEVCGAAYGAPSAGRHNGLKHIEAKAATRTAGGNIEYWYCADCGRYFKDAAATKEITQADTIIAGHASSGRRFAASAPAAEADKGKTVKSGDTGDMGIALYGVMALLSVSGGAWIARKKGR